MITIVCTTKYLKSSEHCKIASPFSRFSRGFFGKYLFKLLHKSPLVHLFYNKELTKDSSESIIVMDDYATNRYLKWIEKHNKNKRLIFWYWQRVKDTIHPSFIPKSFEKWTYCLQDSKKYNMKHNTTLIPNAWDTIIIKNNICPKYDFCFIGKDKGRKNDVLLLSSKLREMGFTVNVFIASNGRHGLIKRGEKRRLSYEDYLKFQNDSKCVIDFCVSSETGLSLRSIEAVLMGKKILTNCLEVSKYSFYSKNNVLLLDHDLSKKEIQIFLSSKVDYSIEKTIEDYSFESWLGRFS